MAQSLLLASLITGFVWEQLGHSATFVAGAAFTAPALLTLFASAACESGKIT